MSVFDYFVVLAIKGLKKVTLFNNVCKIGIPLNLKCVVILNLDCGTILNLVCGTILDLDWGSILNLDCGTIFNLDFETLLNLNFRTLLNYKVTFLTLKFHAPKLIHTQKHFLTHFMTLFFFMHPENMKNQSVERV